MRKRLRSSMLILFVTLLTACDNLDPESIRKRQHLPDMNFVPKPTLGAQLILAHCASCHGPVGQGTQQGPALVNKIYRASHHADISFHWAVRNGVTQHHWKFGDMPAISGISPEEVGHIIAFVRQQQRIAGIQ